MHPTALDESRSAAGDALTLIVGKSLNLFLESQDPADLAREVPRNLGEVARLQQRRWLGANDDAPGEGNSPADQIAISSKLPMMRRSPVVTCSRLPGRTQTTI